MAFTEDLNQFFDTDDFAVEAVINMPLAATRNVKVIFNTPSQSVQIYDTSIQYDAPNCQIKTSDLSGVKQNRDTILINAVTYKIELIIHDGTGISTLQLQK